MLFAAAGAAAAAVFVFIWLVRASLPVLEGDIEAGGLHAPAEIIRSARGVPHIFAADEADAAFALGFVHAQDRLWQMEVMRRFASGRLSEIIGRRTLPVDRRMRAFGFANLAEAQLLTLSPGARASLDAYAAGVNAWLARGRILPPEFHILGFEPGPWRPADSLLWVKMMALNLGGNFRGEIARAQLAQHMGRAKTEEFWYPDADLSGPDAETEGPPAAEETEETGEAEEKEEEDKAAADAFIGARTAEALLEALGGAGAPAGASNAWAVSGDLASGGRPLLANDPHLALDAPVQWYLARVETPGWRAAGATAPGVPFFVLGRNGHIAWGFTTTQGDQQDVFIERLGEDRAAYITPEGPKLFTARAETIRVKGGPPVNFTVRATERGPVITDLLDPESFAAAVTADGGGGARALSLRAAFLDAEDRTPEALFRIGRARNLDEALEALKFVHAPQQNVLVASADRIGFTAAGAVPVRRGRRGRWPARGWAQEDQWAGYLPFEDLPASTDPPDGRIISANHDITAADYPHFITDDWAAPWRAERIAELLAGSSHSAQSFAAAQTDSRSLMAQKLLGLMLKETEPSDERAEAALALLRGWDGAMERGRAAPLIFYAWLNRLNLMIYADDLGALFERHWRLRPRFVARVLSRSRVWCDDTGTNRAETCAEISSRALDEALDGLSGAYGAAMDAWRWGDAHQALFINRIMSRVPVFGPRLADLAIETNGGCCTVNRADVPAGAAPRPFANIHSASYRAAYDLGDLDNSRFMIAAGQSGNPFSEHYGDLLEDWRDGRTFRLKGGRGELRAAAGARTLRLIPAAPQTP